jgi:hypothetical protein
VRVQYLFPQTGGTLSERLKIVLPPFAWTPVWKENLSWA